MIDSPQQYVNIIFFRIAYNGHVSWARHFCFLYNFFFFQVAVPQCCIYEIRTPYDSLLAYMTVKKKGKTSLSRFKKGGYWNGEKSKGFFLGLSLSNRLWKCQQILPRSEQIACVLCRLWLYADFKLSTTWY